MAADVRDTDPIRIWVRSSRCNPGKNCVEIGRADQGVVIRDSKSGTTLRTLEDTSWTAFLALCRAIR
jgi:hypothetical protein